MIRYLVLLVIVTTCVGVASAADQNNRTVIYDGVATEVSVSPGPSTDLWITTRDLTRASRFVIKPQGVCRAVLSSAKEPQGRVHFKEVVHEHGLDPIH